MWKNRGAVSNSNEYIYIYTEIYVDIFIIVGTTQHRVEHALKLASRDIDLRQIKAIQTYLLLGLAIHLSTIFHKRQQKYVTTIQVLQSRPTDY